MIDPKQFVREGAGTGTVRLQNQSREPRRQVCAVNTHALNAKDILLR